MAERWEPGDVVLDADSGLFTRGDERELTKGQAWWVTGVDSGYQPVPEDLPQRPLVLLVRNGQPVGDGRVCTRCGDGDLYPRRCSQCGLAWDVNACGPTHALIAHELGLAPPDGPLGGCFAVADPCLQCTTEGSCPVAVRLGVRWRSIGAGKHTPTEETNEHHRTTT